MTMRFDIERNAQPLVYILSDKASSHGEKLIENLIDFTLIIEGFLNRITDLNKEETKQLLDKTATITRTLVEIVEQRINTNSEIKERLNYLFRMLSKLRCALHTHFTKDVLVKATPIEFKEALSAVSRSSVYHTLSRDIYPPIKDELHDF